MLRVFCACAFAAGSAGQVCQGQETAPEDPASPPVAQPATPDTPLPPPVAIRLPPHGTAYLKGFPSPPPPAYSPTPSRVTTPRRRAVYAEPHLAPSTVPPARVVRVSPQPPPVRAAPQSSCPFCPAMAARAKPARSVLLGFTAKWCAPCQKMNPVLEKLAKQGYLIQRVNIDAAPNLVNRHGIKGIPTFVLIANGKEVERVVGQTSELRLKQMLSRIHRHHVATVYRPAAPVKKKTATQNFQIVCQKMELEFDPKTKQQILRCSGGVSIKSDQFEARAERLTVRGGKLLFDGKVAISIKQAKPNTVRKATFDAPTYYPVPSTGVRYRVAPARSVPDYAPVKQK